MLISDVVSNLESVVFGNMIEHQ